MIDDSLNVEIWDRLLRKRTLEGLPLNTENGRLDLRGLKAPEPVVLKKYHMAGSTVTQSGPHATLREIDWQNLDFTGSKLNALRFFSARILNCKFDSCKLQDLRLWECFIAESSFKAADLRNAALGAVQDGKRNAYSGVDFSKADLRGTTYIAASFERCIFRNAKLVNIDFKDSTFANCQFEGELKDVLFYHRGYKGEAFPPNEMVNVDFSRAKLRDVGFRGLILDRVQLPQDTEHIVIKNYAAAVNEALNALSRQDDATARKLVAFLSIDREWIPPNRMQGVINKRDLVEVVGEEGVDRLLAVLAKQP